MERYKCIIKMGIQKICEHCNVEYSDWSYVKSPFCKTCRKKVYDKENKEAKKL